MKLLIALILTLTIYSNGFNLNSQNRFQNNKVPIISTSPIKEYAYNKLASRVARVQPLFGANLTEVTKDKLLKNAQQLRESADLLEKQSTEKNQTDQAVFISTYAIKSAPIRDPKNINNITVISRNETNMYKNAIIVEERAAKSDSSEKEKKTKLLYEDMDGLRLEAVDSYVESVMTAQKQEAKKNLIENIRKELKSEITAKTISEVMASLFYYQETVRSLEQDSGDGYFKSIANIIEVS